MNQPIRIVIADDHPIVRSGLVGSLGSQPDLEVVGEATTGVEAVALATTLRPDLVLMDIRMPELDGASATQQIVANNPSIRVLVLTTYSTDGDVLRAVEAGAVGYLLKDVPHDELFRAIRAVARGERYIAQTVASRLMQQLSDPPHESLTHRETEVLQWVGRGASNKQVAKALGIAEPTVKAHLVHIFGKLGVDSRTSAVRLGLERGLIELT
ncbi:MAG: response regulator transcription factor [Gemmatimonadaceae bacterium]